MIAPPNGRRPVGREDHMKIASLGRSRRMSIRLGVAAAVLVGSGVGAGDTGSNVIRDPGRTGNPALWISRNAPHVFGLGAIQRLAEEMTTKLKGIRADAQQAACTSGAPVTAALTAKGTSYGSITV